MELKKQLKSALELEIETSIQSLKSSIARAKESALGETKSSAGDKFETTRAMMHRDIEQYSSQLVVVEKNLIALQRISAEVICKQVELGAVVQTSIGFFYISLSGDDIEIDEVEYTPISISSPLAQALIGRSAGDSCPFRGNEITVVSVA